MLRVERSGEPPGIEGRMVTRPLPRPQHLAAAFALVLAACLPNSTPTATFTPVASPTAISAAAIGQHLEALEAIADANGGVRTAGTAGYEASVQYVAEQLRGLGYAVETPEFEMATFAEEPGASIAVDVGGPSFAAGPDFHAMIYSAGGDVTAAVTAVGFGDGQEGGCAPADFDGFTRGTIAVAPPGPCFRRQVVLNAVAAGASALVVSYPQWPEGEVRRPTLLTPDGMEIPALSATGAVGDALRAAAGAGTQVQISVRTEIHRSMVHNVIAESRAVADRVVMLGGHLDSVHDGPGINDNGSGSAALLEVARVLAEEHPGVRARFAFWAGEEFGLLGSRAYVASLDGDALGEIAAYLNFDMLGSTNFVPFVYDTPNAAPGSAGIADFLVDFLEAAGVGAERHDIGGASDHASFDEVGIPTGGIFSGATELKTDAQAASFGGTAGESLDACYHLACDTVSNVNPEQVANFGQAAAALALAIATGQLAVP